MSAVVAGLSDADLAALAHYAASRSVARSAPTLVLPVTLGSVIDDRP